MRVVPSERMLHWPLWPAPEIDRPLSAAVRKAASDPLQTLKLLANVRLLADLPKAEGGEPNKRRGK